MGLSSSYFTAPSLQEYFVDKDTGLPLVGGKVYFYQDNARSVLKPVYELSGVPGNYTYTVLPNPCTLSAVGTFQDASGNDIIPYYYPYDEDGNIQLYYIEVYNSDDVLQFTREGWPNVAEDSTSQSQEITNFIPNGQFILHNNVVASSENDFTPYKISQAVTTIAPGGWSFVRNSMSTAKDFIEFIRVGSSITVPTGNPRYIVQAKCTEAGSDTHKDLRVEFPNVNTFASTTQLYNFYFEAKSVTTGSTIPGVRIIVIKNFGAGGTSPPVEKIIKTITLTSNFQKFNIPILFGTNQAYSIGLNNDDNVQIAIRLPPTGTQNAQFTDFALTIGDTKLSIFPTQTRAEQVAPSTAGWLDKDYPDGYDLYLPLVRTPSGVKADHSQIGKIYASVTDLKLGELNCDGSQYRTDDYSSDGIPYYRLQANLFNTSTRLPLYGTGSGYATAYTTTDSSHTLYLASNSPGDTGTVLPPTNGNSPFTFQIINDAMADTGINAQAYYRHNDTLLLIGLNNGTVTNPSNGTSGFSLAMLQNYGFKPIMRINGVTTAAALANPGSAGKYFTFHLNNPTNTAYYVWFQITDETDPAPGGTGFKINLLSTDLALDVTNKIINLLNGGYNYTILTTAASSITAGHYFKFGTSTSLYYVWYKKDGVGTDPNVANSIGIEVNLVGTDTETTVTNKTQLAINRMYFAVPQFQGMFLRGNDPDKIWDTDGSVRYGYFNNAGPNVGTFELSANQSHTHGLTSTGTVNLPWEFHGNLGGSEATLTNVFGSHQQSFDLDLDISIASEGAAESRPVNTSVNWVIKY